MPPPPKGPKSAPERPQEHPKRAFALPHPCQRAVRTPQNGRKSAPKGPQEEPRKLQNQSQKAPKSTSNWISRICLKRSRAPPFDRRPKSAQTLRFPIFFHFRNPSRATRVWFYRGPFGAPFWPPWVFWFVVLALVVTKVVLGSYPWECGVNSCFFLGCFCNSFKTAVPDDGNSPGASVLTKLVLGFYLCEEPA